ncbi:MAG: tRNA pseudouridine(55) synthase TruB [Candidatus Paceibacterota bacterium]
MEGIFLFNKPQGLTSFEVVNFFKKKTREKVGHGGTLDPLAEGLLIIGVGKATKFLTHFLKSAEKVYLAEIVFGYCSSTYDKEGEIQFVSSETPSLEEIEEVLKEFQKNYFQKPPIYSAVKIKGQPAYLLARKKETINLEPKKVGLKSFEILEYKKNILKIRLKVGSGFYVRSLANDLGVKLKCGGYLNYLKREKICLSKSYALKNEFDCLTALEFSDFEKDLLKVSAYLKGRVQGVGFRFFVFNIAKAMNICGRVMNLKDGGLFLEGKGAFKDLEVFLNKIKKGPPLAKVESIEVLFEKPTSNFSDFRIEF